MIFFFNCTIRNNAHFIPDEQILSQNICLSGIEVNRNITGFGTAVHQLILAQIALIPDEPYSG